MRLLTQTPLPAPSPLTPSWCGPALLPACCAAGILLSGYSPLGELMLSRLFNLAKTLLSIERA